MNRRFQAKLAKSKNVHIIKTTASIPTKFCTVIKTTKCPSWVVTTHALQIQDGGRSPSWKNREIVISQPRFERFRRNLAWWCSSKLLSVPTLKIWNFKNPRWRRKSWTCELSYGADTMFHRTYFLFIIKSHASYNTHAGERAWGHLYGRTNRRLWQ